MLQKQIIFKDMPQSIAGLGLGNELVFIPCIL